MEVDPTVRWAKQEVRYGAGCQAMIGRWAVAEYHTNPAKKKRAASNWTCTCSLPGMERHQGYAQTEDEARAMLENIVRIWFNGLLVSQAETKPHTRDNLCYDSCVQRRRAPAARHPSGDVGRVGHQVRR